MDQFWNNFQLAAAGATLLIVLVRLLWPFITWLESEPEEK